MIEPFPFQDILEQAAETTQLQDKIANLNPGNVFFAAMIAVVLLLLLALAVVESFGWLRKTIAALCLLAVGVPLIAFIALGSDLAAYNHTREQLVEWLDDTYQLTFTEEQVGELSPKSVTEGSTAPILYTDDGNYMFKRVPGGLILQQVVKEDVPGATNEEEQATS